jgi:hypothetical protein
MTRWVYFTLAISLAVLSGCGPATTNKALQGDKSTLNGAALFDLVSGNSLILSAYDFSGTVYFSESGLLAGIDNENQQDVGTWDITDNDQLCLKFRLWYYGDKKCYSLVADAQADRVNFFTSNGAAYYTGMSVAGDPAGLARELKRKAVPKSVRQDLARQKSAGESTASPDAPPAASATKENKENYYETANNSADDAGQTVKRLAGNCPGCNMAGIDLKEASLIKANLAGANLTGADLRYANLRRANLAGANLRGAQLNFANLPGADLSDADLSNANLSGANLLLTNFSGADVSGTIFTNANLEKTIGLEK